MDHYYQISEYSAILLKCGGISFAEKVDSGIAIKFVNKKRKRIFSNFTNLRIRDLFLQHIAWFNLNPILTQKSIAIFEEMAEVFHRDLAIVTWTGTDHFFFVHVIFTNSKI